MLETNIGRTLVSDVGTILEYNLVTILANILGPIQIGALYAHCLKTETQSWSNIANVGLTLVRYYFSVDVKEINTNFQYSKYECSWFQNLNIKYNNLVFWDTEFQYLNTDLLQGVPVYPSHPFTGTFSAHANNFFLLL